MNGFVVAYGNPWDGLHLCGPFDDAESANEYADDNIKDEWWVVELVMP